MTDNQEDWRNPFIPLLAVSQVSFCSITFSHPIAPCYWDNMRLLSTEMITSLMLPLGEQLCICNGLVLSAPYLPFKRQVSFTSFGNIYSAHIDSKSWKRPGLRELQSLDYYCTWKDISTDADLVKASKALVGDQMQMPPMYSAIKVSLLMKASK